MDMSCQTDFNFLCGDVFAILILSRGASRTQALKAHPRPRHSKIHFNFFYFTLTQTYRNLRFRTFIILSMNSLQQHKFRFFCLSF
jgi:hypothetical protein